MKPIHPCCLAATLVLGISPLVAQELKLHPELATAASKVDSAGSFFEVDLVKEDIEMLLPYADLVGEFLQDLDEDLSKVDVCGMLEASGLLDLSAVAKSNTRDGDSWLNKINHPVLLKAQPEEALCGGHGWRQLQHPGPHFAGH